MRVAYDGSGRGSYWALNPMHPVTHRNARRKPRTLRGQKAVAAAAAEHEAEEDVERPRLADPFRDDEEHEDREDARVGEARGALLHGDDPGRHEEGGHGREDEVGPDEVKAHDDEAALFFFLCVFFVLIFF